LALKRIAIERVQRRPVVIQEVEAGLRGRTRNRPNRRQKTSHEDTVLSSKWTGGLDK
jgi:hypothetical protein